MRNVARTKEPKVLARNGRRWAKEFGEAIHSGDTKLIALRRRKYNTPEVRKALSVMYQDLCCYCESEVGPVGADQIDHRIPVDHSSAKAFEWDNLHLACAGCNCAKSKKWDTENPILDAVADVPITDHLDYDSTETGIRRLALTNRGRVTVDHAALNREALRNARTAAMLAALGVIRVINRRRASNPSDPIAASRLDELEERFNGAYGSMIRWAVENFGV